MGMFDEVLENVGKEYTGGGKGFEYGTHEVTIAVINPTQKKTKNDPKAEVIEVDVLDPTDDERVGHAVLYFHTEGGAKMSVTKILGLIVHNVGEEKKEKVRELGKQLFSKIDDPLQARDIAAKLMADKLVGKKAFFVAEPTGKYKTTNYGDIWHYEAEPQNADEHRDAVADDPLEGAESAKDEIANDEIPNFDDL